MLELKYNNTMEKWQLEGSENVNYYEYGVIYVLDVKNETEFKENVENGVLCLEDECINYEKCYYDEMPLNEYKNKEFSECDYEKSLLYRPMYDNEGNVIWESVISELIESFEMCRSYDNVSLKEFAYKELKRNMEMTPNNFYMYKPHLDNFIEKVPEKIYENIKTEYEKEHDEPFPMSFNRWRVSVGEAL